MYEYYLEIELKGEYRGEQYKVRCVPSKPARFENPVSKGDNVMLTLLGEEGWLDELVVTEAPTHYLNSSKCRLKLEAGIPTSAFRCTIKPKEIISELQEKVEENLEKLVASYK